MSTRNLALRHTIRKATIKDCGLINRLAWKAFPPTYQAILTPEQIEYMMHWMYDEASLRRQMTKEGHVYFIIHVEGEPVGYVSVRPEDAFTRAKCTTWHAISTGRRATRFPKAS